MDSFQIIRVAKIEIDNHLKNDKEYQQLKQRDINNAMALRSGMVMMNLASQISSLKSK
jgi:hypothetical protein